jgi:hypothetical protein
MELGLRPLPVETGPRHAGQQRAPAQSIAELLTQDGSQLRRLVSSRSVGADITLERSEQMPKYLDR